MLKNYHVLKMLFLYPPWRRKWEISSVNKPFKLAFAVKIRFSFSKSNFGLAQQCWIIPIRAAALLYEGRKRRVTWSRIKKTLRSDCMYLLEHADEFDPRAARPPACSGSPFNPPRPFYRDVTFPSPPPWDFPPKAVTTQRAWAWIIIFETPL